MKVHEDIYLAYIPTLAVLPYSTMIYYPELKSTVVTFTIVESTSVRECIFLGMQKFLPKFRLAFPKSI